MIAEVSLSLLYLIFSRLRRTDSLYRDGIWYTSQIGSSFAVQVDRVGRVTRRLSDDGVEVVDPSTSSQHQRGQPIDHRHRGDRPTSPAAAGRAHIPGWA